MKEKELLEKLGEETLYSAKGHFKACDIRRKSVSYTIWICAVLNVAVMFDFNSTIAKILSATSLLGMIALLIWNEGEGKNYRANHKKIAEEYLSLHKEIRECYFLDVCSAERVKSLSEQVRNLDRSDKPEISGFAKALAKKAIERSGETDNWFLKNR